MLFTSSFVAKMEFCMASIWQPSYMTTETHRGLLICAAKSVQDTFQWKLFSICTTFSPDSLRWIGQKIESNWTEPNRRLCLSQSNWKLCCCGKLEQDLELKSVEEDAVSHAHIAGRLQEEERGRKWGKLGKMGENLGKTGHMEIRLKWCLLMRNFYAFRAWRLFEKCVSQVKIIQFIQDSFSFFVSLFYLSVILCSACC